MSFEAKDYPINEIFTRSVFDIPRNQRKYVWKEDNWRDMFEDVIFSISEKKPHFVGSIVLKEIKKEDGLSYYIIIDGQQRITTITLFLVSIMKLFVENDMYDDFYGTVSYLQSKNNKNKNINILNSNYHLSIDSIINGIIDIKEPTSSITAFLNTHILSKNDKNIGETVKFFYSEIKKSMLDSPDPKKHLIDIRSAILDMTAVKIVSTSEEDSYTIFEILNARGQELDSHELLKNHIMRYIQPIKNRDEAKAKWEDMEKTLNGTINKFIKHYATHLYGDIRDKYGSSPYRAIQKNTRGKNMLKVLDDIKLKSEYYNRITNPTIGPEGNCNKVEYEIFVFFKSKRFEQFRPIILSLIHQKELENLSEDNYNLILKYIYNFFVCFTIIGEEKSNKLEDLVFKYSKVLETNYSDQLLLEFTKNLKAKLPGYEWFLNNFKNIGWSNHFDLYKGEKNKKRVQTILEVIEKYISKRNSIDEFTIEHMLPDADNINNSQIGNLIPLEENLNKTLGHESLNIKLDTYTQSNFVSCRNTAQRYKNKDFNPSERTEYLAKLIFNDILELKKFCNSDD